MKIEEIFEEFGRTVRQEKLREIVFTSALEQKIRDKIAKNRNRQYRYFSYAAVAAALIAVCFYLVPLLSTQDSAAVETPPSQLGQTDDQGLLTLETEAFQRLKRAIPDLLPYQIERKDSFSSIRHIFLRKTEREYASFGINKTTGELGYFSLQSADQLPKGEPDRAVAKDKAASFLRIVLEGKSQNYQIGKITPAFHVIDSETSKSVVVGTDVFFQQGRSSRFSLAGAVTVRVDAMGRVVSYSRLDQFDQPALEKLFLHVPQLKEYTLVDKLPVGDGLSITLGKNQLEYVRIQIDSAPQAKEGVLRGFEWKKAEQSQTDGNHTASMAEVMEKTTAFLHDVLGNDFQHYRLSDSAPADDKRSAFLEFQRFVNGVPVLGERIHVTADRAGQVISYSSMAAIIAEAARFADPAEAVPLADVEKELAAQMKLFYRTKPEPMLEYAPSSASTWDIDAKTGKIRYTASFQRATPSQFVFEQSGLAPIKLSPQKNQVIVKNKTDAHTLMREEFGADYSGFIYTEHEDKEQNEKVYAWESSTHTPGRNARIVTDMTSGRVKEISTYRVDSNLKVSKDEAQREAIRFLQTYIDPEVTEVQIAEIIEAGRGNGYTASGDWGFGFYRSYQGIPIIDNSMSDYFVSVDPSTGKANGFTNGMERYGRRMNASGEESGSGAKMVRLPDSKQLVSAEVAAKEYLKHYQLQLAYKLEKPDGAKELVPVLVYLPVVKEAYKNSQIRIDAVTGKAVVLK